MKAVGREAVVNAPKSSKRSRDEEKKKKTINGRARVL